MARGGFLILFDEERRAQILAEATDLADGFSDALSTADWELRRWEVCGLLLDREAITHWGLARRGRRVATGKSRVAFTELAATRIPMAQLEQHLAQSLQRGIVRSRSGTGGLIPAGTWGALKAAVGQLDAGSLASLERLERLRDQSQQPIIYTGASVVAQQRDAVGVALDAFDASGALRRRTLRSWSPPANRLGSFLEGLDGASVLEDQLIARDTRFFPGAAEARVSVLGTVFRVGSRILEVFNLNRSRVEQAIGVDLLYWNEPFNSWVLIQYKCMEPEGDGPGRHAVYRPDASFDEELARMRRFRTEVPDRWEPRGVAEYRLCGDGFYFKLCSRIQLEVLSESLLPGMYLPREFAEAVIDDPGRRGARGGRQVTYENAERHLTNSQFAELLRDGWIGTRGATSARIAEIVRQSLAADRAVVLARSRRPNSDRTDEGKGNTVETLELMGLEDGQS